MGGDIVPADGPRNARIAVIGMGPAKEEIRIGHPFSGPSGKILNDALYRNGIQRSEVFVTNLADTPLPKDPKTGNDSFNVFPLTEQQRHLERLRRELDEVNPNIIIICGDQPLEHIVGKNGITKWRGSILPAKEVFGGRKCVASFHPAFIIRGMFKWLPVLVGVDFKRATIQGKFPDIRYPTRNAIVAPKYHEVIAYINDCETKEYLSVDIETVGHREISCVGIGYRIDEALCIPFTRSGIYNYWSVEEEADIWLRLASLLSNPRIKKVAQNAAFEWLHFWRRRIFPQNMFIDTMLLHHCLYPNFGGTEDIWRGKRDIDNPGHGLAFINSQYTDTPYYKDDGRRWVPGMGDAKFWQYNCNDVMVTLDAGLQMEAEAHEDRQWDVYAYRYVRSFERSLRIEWEGVLLDLALRKSADEQYTARLSEIDARLREVIGFDLNVNSNKQMQEYLYKTKQYEVRTNRKTRRPTADKTVLAYYAEKKQDESLKLILEKRQIEDLLADVIRQQLDDTGHIHTHYKLGGTSGSRWSSGKSILGSGTNLQNVPRQGIARRLFLPN